MADILSQILAGGMLNYGQPNPLDRGLMSGDPSMQLGMQMLANSNTPGRFGGILGRSMLGMQDAQQKNAANQLDMLTKSIGVDQTMQMWPYLQQAMGQAFGQPGQPGLGAQPANPQQVPGAPTAGPTQQGQPQQQAPQQGPMGGVGSPDALANLGGISAFMGRPGGQQLIDLAKFRTENDPAMITQKAMAGNAVSQDLALFHQARAGGRPDVAQGAYIKYLQDSGQLHVSANRGTVTSFGGVTPQQLGLSNFDPESSTQTVNGVQSPIPGGPGTQRTMAAARSVGEAAGQTVELSDAAGNKFLVPKTAIVGGGGGSRTAGAPNPQAAAGPMSTSAAPATSTPFGMSQIGPEKSGMIKENVQQAGKVNEAYQQEAEAGKDMLTNTAELRHAAANFSPDGLADTRQKLLSALNNFDMLTPQEQKELGSAQVGSKIAIQLQAAATKQLGSREAAQIFAIMGKSLPNLTMSADGLEKVSGYMDGIARYKIARATMAQNQMTSGNSAGVNQVRDQFFQNTNPMYFILASTSSAQRADLIKSMGDKAPAFIASWNKAANAGWAPRPNAYADSGS